MKVTQNSIALLGGLALIVAAPIMVLGVSTVECASSGVGGVCFVGHPYWLLVFLPIGIGLVWLGSSRPMVKKKNPKDD